MKVALKQSVVVKGAVVVIVKDAVVVKFKVKRKERKRYVRRGAIGHTVAHINTGC